MNTRDKILRTTLVAGLIMASTTIHANTVALAFETYLPSASGSFATNAALLGEATTRTSSGNYRLPTGSTITGTIQIDLNTAPPDRAASPDFGIYKNTGDFITIDYDNLLLPNPVPDSAWVHTDVARYETERGGSRDLFFFYDGRSADWTDIRSGLRYALTLNSRLWVNTSTDGVLQSDALDQPVTWASSDAVAGEQTDFTLFYRLDTYQGTELIGRNEARITTADITRVSAVPLPPALGIFGSGLLGLAGVARRNRQRG